MNNVPWPGESRDKQPLNCSFTDAQGTSAGSLADQALAFHFFLKERTGTPKHKDVSQH